MPLLVDVDGAGSWAIAYVTWVLADRRPKNPAPGGARAAHRCRNYIVADAMTLPSAWMAPGLHPCIILTIENCLTITAPIFSFRKLFLNVLT